MAGLAPDREAPSDGELAAETAETAETAAPPALAEDAPVVEDPTADPAAVPSAGPASAETPPDGPGGDPR